MSFAMQNNVLNIDVFVGGLPDYFTKQMLEEFASKFAATNVKVLHKNAKTLHKNGFVSFDSIENARHFINITNGQDSLNCGIEFISRFADGKNGECRKVYVANLVAGTTEQDLFALGSQFGNVLSTKMLNQSCGFITFHTRAEAEACIDANKESSITVQWAKESRHKRTSNKRTSSAISNDSPKRFRQSVMTEGSLSRASTASGGLMTPMSAGILTPMSAEMMTPITPVLTPMTGFMPIQSQTDMFGNVITTFQMDPMVFQQMNFAPMQTFVPCPSSSPQ